MPHVNLSTMSRAELRQLLDSSRQRGEAAVTYQVLQEMAVRRDPPERRGLFPARRPSEPRIVEVNLGDPMQPTDDLPPAPKPPDSHWDGDLDLPDAPAIEAPGDWDLRVAPAEPANLPTPRRRRGLPGAGFAAGIVLGVAGGWGVASLAGQTRSPAPAPAPIVTAALALPAAPAPPPVDPIAAGPAAAPLGLIVTAELSPADLPQGAALAPESPDIARDAAARAVEPPPPAPRIEAPRATLADAKGCASEPTPADQEICGDPNLRRLQSELRQAYAEALEAHDDRTLRRQRQLAWREARNTVAEPARLARLYEQRIRKLNAATDEARQLR